MNKRSFYLALALISLLSAAGCFLTSCKDSGDPETLLERTKAEINGEGDDSEFTAFNEDGFFAVCYNLEATPENKAKVLWIGNNEQLTQNFHSKVLKELKKNNILDRIIKEEKSLVMAVKAGEIVFQVSYSPEELASKLNKGK